MPIPQVRMRRTSVVIVGAGPYGLSLAAHLSRLKVSYRIFGQPMSTWAAKAPADAHLQTHGITSNLSAPRPALLLKDFCAARNITYHDRDVPVKVGTFAAYGIAFQQEHVPNLERSRVALVQHAPGGFKVVLENGEMVLARHVILAVGLSQYAHVPPVLGAIDDSLVSHISRNLNPAEFTGKDVTILGAGPAALHLAATLEENGAKACILSQHPSPSPSFEARIGKGRRMARDLARLALRWRMHIFTSLPASFRLLSADKRAALADQFLSSTSLWAGRQPDRCGIQFIRDSKIELASECGTRAVLSLCAAGGRRRSIETDHIVAATGFRADPSKLSFLCGELRSTLALQPEPFALSRNFESAVPGLHLIGASAAFSFGPAMALTRGAAATSVRLAGYLDHAVRRERSQERPATRKRPAILEPQFQMYREEQLS